MYQLTQLDNNANQQVIILLNDGAKVIISFEYRPNQMGWFFGIKYNDINYQNIRLVTAFNLLRAYRNYLPFGLRVDTQTGEEPTDQNDFITGFATVYLLPKTDVEITEVNYYAKV